MAKKLLDFEQFNKELEASIEILAKDREDLKLWNEVKTKKSVLEMMLCKKEKTRISKNLDSVSQK